MSDVRKTNLILGTAGHIDHGKTSLIRALTGTDTDRLPEEKKRGITIELGYAVLELDDFRMGIVDVPGHEKFVRQMLAGATGMDLALLVVAADDSIKRQTQEHLDILRLLDLPAGVIAITKSDLVEDDWLEMVVEEVKELVKGTFLESSPIVITSAASGAGLEELKNELSSAARKVTAATSMVEPGAPFRMAIDRVFAIEGHGTVVTGSVSSGDADIGDQLEIQPKGKVVRIREIQNHDLAVEAIARGQRGAINLAGVHHDELDRGQELCTPGHLLPSKVLTVQIQALPNVLRPVKDRQRIRFHIGTSETLGTIRLLESPTLAAGERAYAQIFLADPIVSVWNQPFVVRNVSPLETIGGGRILQANARRFRGSTPTQLKHIANLAQNDNRLRLQAAIYFDAIYTNNLQDLSRICGVSTNTELIDELIQEGLIKLLKISPQKSLYIHQDLIEEHGDQIKNFLKRMHEKSPLASGFAEQTLITQFSYLPEKVILSNTLAHLLKEKQVNKVGDFYSLAGHGPELSQNEQKLFVQIVQRYEAAALAAPSTDEIRDEIKKNSQSVFQLIELAASQGELIRLTDKIYLHKSVVDTVKERLSESLKDGQGISLSDIRQQLDTSRKYAVPLCEYLDGIGFTRRDGDLRYLA